MRKIRLKRGAFRIAGDKSDHYYRNEHIDKFYETILNLQDKHSVVLDVGGNIGITSFAAASKGCTVYSFEPSPNAFKYLIKNTEINSELRVFPQNVALGAQNMDIGFHESSDSASASHLSDDHTLGHGENTRVAMVRLDDFVSKNQLSRVDLIKIDVEGFELDVLNGATRTLEQYKPAAFIEFNSYCMIAFRNINPRDMLSYIRSKFPFIYEYKKKALSRIVTDDDALSFIHTNLVTSGCVTDLYCSFEEIAPDRLVGNATHWFARIWRGLS